MLKEKIKSSLILILILNLLFLTAHLWFVESENSIGSDFVRYVRSHPVVQRFFPTSPEYSISKENLSKPRKFLINDGSLWMAYYNTDIGFSPINQRIEEIIKGFLKGDITAAKQIDYATWEAGLESLSIYVEFPVGFSTDMFCRIMGVDTENLPEGITSLRELIILPSSEESDVCILVRDYEDSSIIYAYIMEYEYILPATDLSVYTNNDGYYEPAFSTGLELQEGSNVSLSPLVLFSDSHPKTEVLEPHNLINNNSKKALLENFSFNPDSINTYVDADGVENYIANYASIMLHPDSYFEYTAVSDERGILLDESTDLYSILNASIDFAENTWKCVSSEPLSILVTSDLSSYDSRKEHTITFDYYCNGRPVEIELPEQYGHERMTSAIEISVKNGRIISYRQYLRSYSTVFSQDLSDNFITALDSFVNNISTTAQAPVTIKDIYIGYLDNGSDGHIFATWLAKTSDGKIYRYNKESEVPVQ